MNQGCSKKPKIHFSNLKSYSKLEKCILGFLEKGNNDLNRGTHILGRKGVRYGSFGSEGPKSLFNLVSLPLELLGLFLIWFLMQEKYSYKSLANT